MNVFDQAARYAAKLDPAPFFRWLLPRLDPALAFTGWLDTRTLPFPGEPDRTCDTVAGFRNAADPEQHWAVVLESQTEPDSNILDRLLEYLARVRAELRPLPAGRGRFHVAAVVLNLTGPPQADTLDMRLPGEDIGVRLGVRAWALRDESAAATLSAVAEGRLARCVLPWVPLMQGAVEPSIMEQWKQLAAAEVDERLRADYAGLAFVFAELTNTRAAWVKALEGWNVRQSQQVLEWRAEGRLETKRDDVLQLLRLRFQTEVPADLATTVEATTDLNELSRWFAAAAVVPSLDAFRNAVQQNGR